MEASRILHRTSDTLRPCRGFSSSPVLGVTFHNMMQLAHLSTPKFQDYLSTSASDSAFISFWRQFSLSAIWEYLRSAYILLTQTLSYFSCCTVILLIMCVCVELLLISVLHSVTFFSHSLCDCFVFVGYLTTLSMSKQYGGWCRMVDE